MSQDYRSKEEDERPTSKRLRRRWPEDSLYVLDIDNLICDTRGERGLLIEWKHANATDKTWKITRALARRAGWESALFEFRQGGNEILTSVMATFLDRQGRELPPTELVGDPGFDAWVLERFGNGHP